MHSHTRGLDGTQVSGPGFVADMARDGKHVTSDTRYTDLAPGFDAKLGYIKRVDIRQLEEEFKYRWRPAHGPVEKYGPTLDGVYVTDHFGGLQEWKAGAGFRVEVAGPSELEVKHSVDVLRYEGVDFQKRVSSVELTTDHLHWLGLDALAQWGTDVNFDPAPGLSPFLANANGASVEMTVRPSPRLSLAQTWIYSGLADHGSVFDNVLLRTKLNYQFTRAFSLRAILDHSRVSRDATRADLDPERRIGVDLLGTYLLSPGTAFYVGYSDNLENLALDPGTPPTLRRTDIASLSTGRQFFVKASVLIHR
jgi:hypothetical protein